MNLLGCAVVLASGLLVTSAAGEETKLGGGVTLTEATPIKAVIERPDEFVGKTIRVDGVATGVCQHMGCWMAVADESDAKGATVRLKVDHGGGIVFPVTAKGKQVSAEGVFEAIGEKDEHANEAAGEHGKHDATASKKYQIKATGAVVK
jgi:hypothetical protein